MKIFFGTFKNSHPQTHTNSLTQSNPQPTTHAHALPVDPRSRITRIWSSEPYFGLLNPRRRTGNHTRSVSPHTTEKWYKYNVELFYSTFFSYSIPSPLFNPPQVAAMQRLWPAFLLALVCLCTLSTAAPTASTPFPMPKCNGFQLEEASIDDIQQQLSSGSLTSRQLVHCYLERISTVNPYLQ